MRILKTSLLFLLAVAAIAQTSGTAAQTSETTVMSGNAILQSGAVFDFRAVLRPPGKADGLGEGGVIPEPGRNLVHRYMIDRGNKQYSGYDVEVGTPDATGAYLVTFKALSNPEKIEEMKGLKAATMPQFPPAELMHDGEVIELDFMRSPDGRRRLTDIIAIQMHNTRPPAATTVASPRDFTIDDGAITFDLSRYEFWKQGQEYKGMSGFTGKPGKTLWFTIPGDGRYILSLVPHEGFTKSGTVRDNVVAFGDPGKQYELRLRSPVAGAGKAWNLYVLHGPGAFSLQGLSGAVQFGTDRLENLLPR